MVKKFENRVGIIVLPVSTSTFTRTIVINDSTKRLDKFISIRYNISNKMLSG